MLVFIILLEWLGWIVAVVAFEIVWQFLNKKGLLHFCKGTACRGWWAILGLLSVATNPAIFLLSLIAFVPVGLSHMDLANRKDTVISILEIVRNIPNASREFLRSIQPYIK